MNTWLQFLTQKGASLSDTTVPEVIGFGDTCPHQVLSTGFIAPLTDVGLLAVSGEDAAKFLHNQLTNDVEHLQAGEARLAGYCSPKGRLLATLLLWKSADTIWLQLPYQIQAMLQKRLHMFVLRAKARLDDVTDHHVMLGIGGASASVALTEWFPTLPGMPYASVVSDAGTLIRMPDADNASRYQWITTPDIAQTAWPTLTRTLTAVGNAVWRLTNIHAGIPQITQSTQEHFVPQMINFEAIGGVNFKKGCYPGQEIVARSQYLGKLKRRMMLAFVDSQEATAGLEVFSSADPEQPCGEIVNAESNLQGGMDCLVEMKVAALQAGSVHLGLVTGPALQFKPLPYPLPDTV